MTVVLTFMATSRFVSRGEGSPWSSGPRRPTSLVDHASNEYGAQSGARVIGRAATAGLHRLTRNRTIFAGEVT